MRIAIDASRTTVARVTGTERYALELIRALIAQNTQHDLHLYFRDTPAPDLLPSSPRITPHVIPFRRAWTHARFAAALWTARPDLTFVPAHTLPFAFPGRAMVTVHDLGYRLFPQAHTWAGWAYLDATTRYSSARADIVLADSQATARDLARFYRTPEHKIHVVYPGVTAPVIGDVAAVRAKYDLPQRYWLFVGTLQPRKNIAALVQGYARWRAQSGDDAALVLAGGRGWLYDPAWTAGVDGVIETGYIDEADKGALYAGALGLLFPSLYEGFGFPVLEAMHCGTPVICSSSSSLPEVGGDAALYVPLLDDPAAMADALAAQMAQVVGTPMVSRLRERGRAQAAQFTWSRAAERVLSLLG
ncbi:MAG: glycosyltransferase family 1 protein [Chloroflexota bacterium]|nr:glycosyltransferase family 1 protein [Chloroflexota bacterium]